MQKIETIPSELQASFISKPSPRLIAAAPELLEALQAATLLLREYDFPGAHPHRKAIYKQARDAISKATGAAER